MSRPTTIPQKTAEIARIEAEARRMRAEFLTGAFRASSPACAAKPPSAHPARA
jgi:hypothetical protein